MSGWPEIVFSIACCFATLLAIFACVARSLQRRASEYWGDADTPELRCADCGGAIGVDLGPPDGWQLEDGRTVCHDCCVNDTRHCLRESVSIGHRGRELAAAEISPRRNDPR